MLQVDVRVRLEKFAVIRTNESSDEPFLWVLGVKFDGVTAGNVLQRPEEAKLEFFLPPGRHGNLGSGAANTQNQKPIPIPSSIGLWDTTLEFDPVQNLPMLAPLSTLAIFVVGLEEDATADTHAIEAHRRVTEFVRKELTQEVRGILSEAVKAFQQGGELPSAADTVRRLQESVNSNAVMDVINGLRDDLLPAAIAKSIVNPIAGLFSTLPAAVDPDDLVGQAQANYTLPRLIADAVDGQEIKFELNRDKTMAQFVGPALKHLPPAERERLRDIVLKSGTGHFRVTGRTQRTDLCEPPTVGAFWSPRRIAVFARSYNKRVAHAESLDGGVKFRGWNTHDDSADAAHQQRSSAGIGVAASQDGSRIYLLGRRKDEHKQDGIYLSRSTTGIEGIKKAGSRFLPAFDSRYGACAALSETARRLHVFAVSEDHRVHWSWSNDGGDTWDLPWGFVGRGLLDAAPAACISADGQHLNVFGLGRDRQIWRASTPDGGVTWTHLWSRSGLPDGEGFSSAPACVCSADGKALFVIVKAERNYAFLRSADSGATWDSPAHSQGDGRRQAWRVMEKRPPDGPSDGFFISAPGVCASPDLSEVHVFGVYSDMRMYHRVLRGEDATGWAPIGVTVFA